MSDDEVEYEIQGKYEGGWETVNTETTRADAERSLREYRENEPDYSHRMRIKRVPL